MGKRERGTGCLLKPKGCRFWAAQFYDANGKQRRVSTRKESKMEAQAFLRNLLTDKSRGIQFERKMKYEELKSALLQDYAARGNKSLIVMSDGTETIWALKAVDTYFKDWTVSNINTDAARDFAHKLSADGASNGTVNKSLALLRRMLSIAHEDGKLHVVPKIRMLKAGAARKGFLEREKFEELLSNLPPNLKPLVTFLYYCGVRLGEALQITWQQVDLDAALVRLEPDQTKNAEARIVPLPDVLVGMLKLQERGDTVFDGTNLRKDWHKACVARWPRNVNRNKRQARPAIQWSNRA
jgi:integrase